MVLTPIDVQQKTFRVAWKGYAEEEVDDFLDEVVTSLREHEQRLRDAEERVAVLEEQLAANRDTENAFKRAFVVAERTAADIVSEAREEARRIVAEANTAARDETADQLRMRESLAEELSSLQGLVENLRRRLRLAADSAESDLAGLAEEAGEALEHYRPEVDDAAVRAAAGEIDADLEAGAEEAAGEAPAAAPAEAAEEEPVGVEPEDRALREADEEEGEGTEEPAEPEEPAEMEGEPAEEWDADEESVEETEGVPSFRPRPWER